MYKLIIEDDEGKTTVVPLIRDEISIGRKEGNTIRLTERNVSRRHAKLLRQTGAVFIEDLASYNGIKVNGNRINGRVAIAEGDRIQIGDYVLGLKVEGQAAKAVETEEGAETADTERATAQLEVTDLSDSEPTAVVSTEPPRLVCVSSNFAGMEWVVNKPVMVIGRTDDNNDVVINHRSISRHHARVVEEHGRYTIVDMQSANGVWVNGEDYGKVELRKGDLVDLGHVRLRFVAPGEDFVFERDAVIVDPAQLGGRSRGAMWVILALLALAAVGVFLWKLMEQPPGEQGQTKGAEKPIADKPVPEVKDQTALLSQINAAMERREWQRAIKYCAELNAEARKSAHANCERAALEKRSQKLFEDAVSAATKNEHQGALALFLKIPKTSTYYHEREKSAVYLETRKKYKAQAAGDVDDAITRGDCAGAKKIVQLVGSFLGESLSEFDAKLKACQAPTVAVVPPTKKPPRGKRPATKRPPRKRPPRKASAPTEEQKAAAKQLKEQVWGAYRRGEAARTVLLGKKYLRVFPRDQQILSIVGASACKKKDRATAKWVLVRLLPARRNMLKNFCSSRNVSLP